MFKPNPWKLCSDLRQECMRSGVVQFGQRGIEVMHGITSDGSQIRITNLHPVLYRVTVFPAGAIRPLPEWAVQSDGSATPGNSDTPTPLDATTLKVLKSARPVPGPKTLYRVMDRDKLAAILMTKAGPDHKLEWTVFRSPDAGGRPRFTKTTGAGTFLDAGRWWGWNPVQLRLPQLRQAGMNMRFVQRNGRPAVIWVGSGGVSGNQGAVRLYAPDQAPAISSELVNALPLYRWFEQGS